MRLYAIRLMGETAACGLVYCYSKRDIIAEIDVIDDPSLYEYKPIKGDGAIFWNTDARITEETFNESFKLHEREDEEEDDTDWHDYRLDGWKSLVSIAEKALKSPFKN